jgi:hypothetical protein
MACESLASLAQARQLWLVDQLFSMAPGVADMIVNPGFFADAYLAMTGVAAQLGVFPWI